MQRVSMPRADTVVIAIQLLPDAVASAQAANESVMLSLRNMTAEQQFATVHMK